MASELDYNRLRRDVGATEEDLDDVSAEALFVEAAETYSGTASIKAQTRVLAIQGMIAAAANEVDVTQNESSEKLGQIPVNLARLLRIWQDNLQAALSAEAEVLTPGSNPPAPSGTVRLRPVW